MFFHVGHVLVVVNVVEYDVGLTNLLGQRGFDTKVRSGGTRGGGVNDLVGWSRNIRTSQLFAQRCSHLGQLRVLEQLIEFLVVHWGTRGSVGGFFFFHQ